MQRVNEVIEYEKDDNGTIVFPRKNYQAEIIAKVSDGGVAYVGRAYAGKEVRVMVSRD